MSQRTDSDSLIFHIFNLIDLLQLLFNIESRIICIFVQFKRIQMSRLVIQNIMAR